MDIADPAIRAYDWEILIRAGDEWNVAALGRTDSLRGARKHVMTELDALPPHVQAKAHIHLMGPLLDLGDRTCLWSSPVIKQEAL